MENISSNNDNNKLSKTYMYILYFFIFAIFGWLLETIHSFISLGHFTNRGFLYGPLCPIYGYGAIILILFLRRFKNQPLKLFTYSAAVFTIFEYYVSYILEALFHEHWWDYSTEFMNINGRISIFYFFAWGILALIFIGYIYPFIEKKINKLLNKINSKFIVVIINLICIIYIIDTIASCVRYLI